MPKEGYLFNPEFTLAELSIELMCPESSEDDSKVMLMVPAILGINKDVVDEDYNLHPLLDYLPSSTPALEQTFAMAEPEDTGPPRGCRRHTILA